MKKSFISLLIVSIISPLCLGFLPTTARAAGVPADWAKGGTIQPLSTTDFASTDMKRSLDTLRGTGANYVTLIIPYYQQNRQSTNMYPAWNTPTDEALITAIDYAHSIGLKVMLKPHLETDYIEWRGNIDPAPTNRAAWFNSYGTMLEKYGRIAQAHGVEDYCIGAELLRMTMPSYGSTNTQSWRNMIARVRAIYSGKVTYSADRTDEFEAIEFWPQLDYIGISAYFDLYNAQNNSVEELKKAWDAWRVSKMEPMQRRYNKPIVITEIGYRSITGTYREPWDWGRWGEYNETDQANAYEALFSYWAQYPWIKGVHIWRWEVVPPAPNSGNTDYTPQNKKAEQVMRTWWNGTGTPPVIPPGSQPPVQGTSWTASASANPSTVVPNQSTTFSVSVQNTSNLTVPNTVVDVEIYNEAGNRVLQNFFGGENFAPHQTKTYSAPWTGGPTGKYIVKVGVFNSSWQYNYYWGNEVKTLTVGDTTPPQQPGPTSLEIWWPSNGASVQGLQPFKAMLTERDIATYEMWWQVDGDRLNPMYTSTTDYPHKEAMVDLTGWNWREDKNYNINFVTKDTSGNVILQRAVDIHVEP